MGGLDDSYPIFASLHLCSLVAVPSGSYRGGWPPKTDESRADPQLRDLFLFLSKAFPFFFVSPAVSQLCFSFPLHHGNDPRPVARHERESRFSSGPFFLLHRSSGFPPPPYLFESDVASRLVHNASGLYR